jgi:hypothetical protein
MTERIVNKFWDMKTSSIISILIIVSFIIFAYQFHHHSQSNIIIKVPASNIHQSRADSLSFERRTNCNYRKNEMCYSTNKSLVVTFWQRESRHKWVSQNILSAFPLHSFDHIIFVFDDSSWRRHPGYKHFIWIHVKGQLRLWYVKRFITPIFLKSYQFIWIIDDDAQLDFIPLHYQCVVANLSIPLSAPGRLTGALSHGITELDANFVNHIGRWTDFVEGGPILIATSLAWQCIYMYLDASTGSGWGLDWIWCNMLAERCLPSSESKKVCAILDAFNVHHQSAGMSSIADGAPELPIYTQLYKTWSTKQQNIGPLAKDKQLFEFCKK